MNLRKLFEKKRKGYEITFYKYEKPVETFYEKTWKGIEEFIDALRETPKTFSYGSKDKMIFLKWESFDYIKIEKVK